ncbi:conserved hypothetical protein [Methanocella paludicola SANAE]|uniref:Uncharacterized protein n=1 Tax=Methanocella paludicola (strain DSM 17711 / JCM 13418 / NBRC 101707 / SANAE) TaxID=304371 RepID=D1YZH0_METPS|nr:hypothetical protein [Methanocella paludicola]BAI61842.1 conserved hypothetical protein [Methanocella paludicola SANAE]
MLNRLKGILGSSEKKEEQPAELPVVQPFIGTDVETAPAPIHKPVRVKADIDHAGHMRTISHNDDEAKALEAEALRAAREKKTVMYGEDAVSAYLSNLPCLKLITITKNGETLCSFPFFNAGRPVDLRITEITECRNGYEGQLEAYVKGSIINFFDAAYFKNKNTYFPGKEARVLLAGIAYVLSCKRADKKARESADSDLAFHYENGDVDDYVFRGKVKDVRECQVLGRKAQIILVDFRTGADSVIDMYVCATENAIREKVHKGDHVSGIIWLQGFTI